MTSTRSAPAAVVLAFRLFLGYATIAFVGWAWLIGAFVFEAVFVADPRSTLPGPPPTISVALVCAGWGTLFAVGPTVLVMWAAIRARAGSNAARAALLATAGVQLPIAALGTRMILTEPYLESWIFGAASLVGLGFAVAGSIAMFRDSANAYFLDPRLRA